MIKGQLTDTDRTEIVKYRIEKAYRTYQEAVGSIKNGYVETSGIQSVRVYLLTAICSLFFTLFIKTLVKLIADCWGYWIMRQNK